jgi:hypothetical protein
LSEIVQGRLVISTSRLNSGLALRDYPAFAAGSRLSGGKKKKERRFLTPMAASGAPVLPIAIRILVRF